jgi:uncharacterized Zn finger protein
VFTISDDQTTCVQCGDRHFAILSLDQPVMLACLECGYAWSITQPVENESEKEDLPAIK